MRKYAVLTLICVSVLLICNMSANSNTDTITVFAVKGNARVIRLSSNIGYKCAPDMEIKQGDWLSTGDDSYVAIAFGNRKDNIVRLEENTLVRIKDGTLERIELFDGHIITRLQGLRNNEQFIIRTPSGVCGAKGTSWSTLTDGVVTHVSVFEHSVFMKGLNKDGTLMDEEVMVEEGCYRKVAKYEAPQAMAKIDKSTILAFRQAIIETIVDRPVPEESGRTARASSPERTAPKMASSGIVIVDGVGVNRDRAQYMRSSGTDEQGTERSSAEEAAVTR